MTKVDKINALFDRMALNIDRYFDGCARLGSPVKSISVTVSRPGSDVGETPCRKIRVRFHRI
jgi:hypothetical protein